MKLVLLFFILAMPAMAAKSLKSHSHGAAKVSIAADSKLKMVEVKFQAAAHGVMGFEWRPATEKEKADWKKVEETWNAGLVVIEDSKKCVLTKKSIEMEFEKHGDHEKEHGDHHKHDKHKKKSGTHSEVHGTYSYKCEQDPAGAKVTVQIMEKYNGLKLSKKHKLKEIEVEVIPAKKSPYEVESHKASLTVEL